MRTSDEIKAELATLEQKLLEENNRPRPKMTVMGRQILFTRVEQLKWVVGTPSAFDPDEEG